ncbi:prosaposin-like [Protopterus annectens]|uniref:prosaposin-like n=1 Tax=Protopterus annectens TaxID=7888 RepID=UPI001CF9FD1A|nr:prosaposin-like [Protopterus annectens]
MIFYLLLLAFGAQTTVVFGKALTHADCGNGPDYWCKDKETAVQCDVIDYCEQHVWNVSHVVMDFPPDEIDLCHVCVQVIGIVLKLLEAGTKFEYALRQACDLLPWYLSPECKMIISAVSEAIKYLIEKGADAKTICVAAHFCNRNQHEEVLLYDTLMGKTDCGACQSFITQVKPRVTSDIDEAALTQILERVCSDSFYDHPECKKFLETYMNRLLEASVMTWGAKVTCQLVKACNPMEDVTQWEAKECEAGPLYWCNSVETARKCKVEKLCRAYIW